MGNSLLRAGRIDRRVTIVRPGDVELDGFGQAIAGLDSHTETWARAEPAPGSERYRNAELAAHAPMRFVLRWREDLVRVTDHLLLDGRRFDIASVTEIARREGIEVLATARGEAVAAAPDPAATVPAPISVSDFVNGVYLLNGEAMSLADLWEPSSGQPFTFPFIEGSIVEGVGWITRAAATTYNAMYATAGHKAALPLLDGIAAVLEYDLDQPEGTATKPRIVLAVTNEPYDNAWGLYQNGAAGDRYLSVYDFGDIFLQAPPAGTPVGPTRVAAVLGSDELAFSADGAAALVAPDPLPLGSIGLLELTPYTSHPGTAEATAILKNITIYPKVAAALLPALSAS
jgi:head-tail adaptor